MRPQWRYNYVDYKLLKDLIKASLAELEGDDNARLSFSPRTTSLTVQRANRGRKSSEEEFFEILEQQVYALVLQQCTNFLVAKCTLAHFGFNPGWRESASESASPSFWDLQSGQYDVLGCFSSSCCTFKGGTLF